jgi:hypothetical protein
MSFLFLKTHDFHTIQNSDCHCMYVPMSWFERLLSGWPDEFFLKNVQNVAQPFFVEINRSFIPSEKQVPKIWAASAIFKKLPNSQKNLVTLAAAVSNTYMHLVNIILLFDPLPWRCVATCHQSWDATAILEIPVANTYIYKHIFHTIPINATSAFFLLMIKIIAVSM